MNIAIHPMGYINDGYKNSLLSFSSPSSCAKELHESKHSISPLNHRKIQDHYLYYQKHNEGPYYTLARLLPH